MSSNFNVKTAPGLRLVSSGLGLVAALAAVAVFAAQEAEARGPGGGLRAEGGGLSRPSGGGFSRGSAARPQRPSGQKPQAGSATAGNRKSQVTSRGNGNSAATASNSGNNRAAAINNGNANSGVVGSGNGNTGAVNNGNVGSGNVNTGNVAVGNDVNVDVNSGWAGYPAAGTGAAYATGVAVGATTTATATAVAVGSYYYALPPSCSPYYYSSYRYYACGGTWYQERYQSGSTVYVVVTDPSKSK